MGISDGVYGMQQDDRFVKRRLMFLLGSVALINLPHYQHLPAALFGFFALSLSWRAACVRYRWLLPNRIQLFVLTLFAIALLISQRIGIFGREAGTAVFVVALGLKLLEIRSRRDVYLVVYLAFIAAAFQFLYEQSILMAAYILLVCTLLLATLIIQNAGQLKVLAAMAKAAAIILQAIPLAAVVFVLFPRLEAPRWMWLKDDSKALSGLTDTLEPGSISELSLSEELVFRVRFKSDIPSPRLRYWRGPVYTHTDGVRWIMAGKTKRPANPPSFTGLSYQYTLLMEPQKENWVFPLDAPESFDSHLRRNAFNQLLTDKRRDERAEYTITSRPLYNTGAISDDERRESLQLPLPASPKQAALIQSLGGFTGQHEQFIQNLLNHFRQEEFYYTLTPPLMPDNPVDTFLFETKSGFCSHYATAFVYLLRLAGIPARVVGGYQGGQINEIGGFLEVRQANAHAWAEAWLDGQGWVRFDPTAAIAPERIERGVDIDAQLASGVVSFTVPVSDTTALRWLKRTRQLWQSVDYNWQRWVINYRSSSQKQLLQLLGVDNIVALAKYFLISILLVTVPLAWSLLRRKASKTDKAVSYYRRYCAKLAKGGIEIRLGEGPFAFAERVKKQCPELAAKVEKITTVFIKLRYHVNPEAADLQTLKSLVNDFHIRRASM
ncbi:MAG: transglutaminase TgpA family protein [Gammaproteobacteria bacterium]